MKNIFRKYAVIRELHVTKPRKGITPGMIRPLAPLPGQEHATDFSSPITHNGIGFGWAMLLRMKVKGSKSFEIADTNSMLPSMDKGHIAYAIPIKWEDLRVNHIILYRLGNDLISHRITKIDHRRGRAICKGDNNLFSDLPVMKNQIEYLVIGVSSAR